MRRAAPDVPCRESVSLERGVNLRKLGTLLTGIADEATIGRGGSMSVTGVFDDSRQVQPGSVFIAVRGTAVDGRQYIVDAVGRGARVVVGEDLPAREDVLVVNVPDGRAALARLAARWYGLEDGPAAGLKLVGVTGTNGKTTTALMLQAIVRAAGIKCGFLGTIGYDLCGRQIPAENTTPGALQLAAALAECAAAGAGVVVMEISSHAINQQRVAGLRLAAAGYTNLSEDHLDYHGSLEEYRSAKAQLFATLEPSATAVLNFDDKHVKWMSAPCRARQVWYSLEKAADIEGRILGETINGTGYRLSADGDSVEVESALIGQHNVYNALAATGLARALGLSGETIQAGLAGLRHVPGRLERVTCASEADVFVDYAHTEDALYKVLKVLRPLTRRRLVVVFGCGGDRDRGKRPRMAAAVAEFADEIVVTSDNPRGEDPERIIKEILPGFNAEQRRRVQVEPDRARAIALGVQMAGAEDVLLIAGKGHERYQILGNCRLHFDDVEVARRMAARVNGERGGEA
ncbi:MAG: UDP-N-acetylmuramoyl-L-alanyl-D-glutamate--2,6-diaminopimelate ligase [Planctomycetota bacterium]